MEEVLDVKIRREPWLTALELLALEVALGAFLLSLSFTLTLGLFGLRLDNDSFAVAGALFLVVMAVRTFRRGRSERSTWRLVLAVGLALCAVVHGLRAFGVIGAGLTPETACRTGNGGVCLDLGTQALDRDHAAALAYFRSGCEAKDMPSCRSAGIMYAKGDGAAADPERAHHYLTRACNQDEPDACLMLGVYLFRGEGWKHDPPRALGVSQRACKLGVGRACANVGIQLRDGTGVPASASESENYFARACELGVKDACPR